MRYSWPEIKKAVVAGVSFVVTVLSLALAQGDIIPESWLKWVVLVIGVAGTYGVFKVSNSTGKAPLSRR